MNGLKCAICVMTSLNGKDMSTEAPVQEGLDNAKTAVTMCDGMAMCVAHLHERLNHQGMAHFMSDLERQLLGRR